MKNIHLNLIVTAIMLMPILSNAQEDKDKTKAKVATAVSVGSGLYSYQKLRKETVYLGYSDTRRAKTLHKSGIITDAQTPDEIILHGKNNALSEKSIKKIMASYKPGDKFQIKEWSNDFLDEYHLSPVHTTKNPNVIRRLLESKKGSTLFRVSKVRNVITLQALRKASPFELGMAFLSLSSAAYAAYEWNTGSNERSKGRLDMDRRVVDKESGSQVKSAQMGHSARNQ